MREEEKDSGGLVQVYSPKMFKLALKKIRCPIHHVVKPGCLPYQIEPNPLAKNFSDDMCKKFKLKKWRYKKDRYGQKIPDYNNHYQPEISAAYAKEKIYNIARPICNKCRRCLS